VSRSNPRGSQIPIRRSWVSPMDAWRCARSLGNLWLSSFLYGNWCGGHSLRIDSWTGPRLSLHWKQNPLKL